MGARLSTCARCGGIIERRPGAVAGWGHVVETPRNADGHLPDPDDSAVAGLSVGTACEVCGDVRALDGHELCRPCLLAAGATECHACDGIEGACDDDCAGDCCEAQRALDDDADGYAERCHD